MDNGFLSVDQPQHLQTICDSFGPAQIQALFQRWQAVLPQPFTDADRQGGFDYASRSCARRSA